MQRMVNASEPCTFQFPCREACSFQLANSKAPYAQFLSCESNCSQFSGGEMSGAEIGCRECRRFDLIGSVPAKRQENQRGMGANDSSLQKL